MDPYTVDFAFSLTPDEPLLPGETFHRLLAELRAEHRLAPVRFLGAEMGLITGYDDLDAAFRNDAEFPAGPTYANSIEPCQGFTFESCDGPEHHVLRDLSTRGLRARPVARYAAEHLPAIAHRVIDAFADRPTADLVANFTAVFPFLVFGHRMGLPGSERDHAARYYRWAFDILGYPGDNATGLAAAAALTDYVEPVLAERRGCPADDLLSSMSTAVKAGRRLNDEEILSHVRALFSAGAATSHHGLGNTIYALLRDPESVARLRAEPDLIPHAVDEMLRWEPPIGILPRLVSQDVELAGEVVRAGSMVLMGIASANRDERIYPNPDRFDPDRFNPGRFEPGRRAGRLLTFGFGSHYCPGSHLAKAQIVAGVTALLERFPKLSLTDPDIAQPVGTVMRGPRVLPVALH
ncbi:MAG: cytochrome P450 [Acidimicrobiales bacterium]|nr:cytochrome P450 [Acidimicrobiales bacterium]